MILGDLLTLTLDPLLRFLHLVIIFFPRMIVLDLRIISMVEHQIISILSKELVWHRHRWQVY